MHGGQHRLAVPLSVVACTLYTFVLLVRPDAWCPASILVWYETPRLSITQAIEWILATLDLSLPSFATRYTLYYLVTAAVLPWCALAIFRRGRAHDLGLRCPNRLGLRIILVGTVVSVPCLWWMIRQPGAAQVYAAGFERWAHASALISYLAVVLAEHFFFLGSVLAVCRHGGRWPPPPPVDRDATTRWGRTLQWFGLAQTTRNASGLQKTTRWLGLPDGCFVAVVCSGFLFAAVHLGKNPRELLLSLPGGLASAYLAYRCNSWLVPAALHFAVAAVTAALVYLN